MSNSQLKLIKLSYGEEVLGKITKPNDSNQVTVEEAVAIQIGVGREGEMKLEFLPWTIAMFSEENVVTLEQSHIVAVAEPVEELKQRHSTLFGRVHVPEKKLIIPN